MPTEWQLSLLPASWRGVPFGVRGGTRRAGRRVALHEYPFRDQLYPEDLGRAGRIVNISGFVIGDDAGAQMEALLEACEQPGPGTLVHPIYGVLSNRQLVAPAETEERWDQGRVIEIRMMFVEAGQVLYPSASVDTPAQSQSSVTDATNPVSASHQQAVSDAGGSNLVTGGAIPAAIANATPQPIETTPSNYSTPELFGTADFDFATSAGNTLSNDAAAGAPTSTLSEDAAAAAFAANSQILGAGP